MQGPTKLANNLVFFPVHRLAVLVAIVCKFTCRANQFTVLPPESIVYWDHAFIVIAEHDVNAASLRFAVSKHGFNKSSVVIVGAPDLSTIFV
jgi:hypothetical protein